jgi:hypothetical protein
MQIACGKNTVTLFVHTVNISLEINNVIENKKPANKLYGSTLLKPTPPLG